MEKCETTMKSGLRKFCLLALVLLTGSLTLSAQNRTVTGKVVDETLAPVAGAMVTVQDNNTLGTITGVDGAFTLSVPPSAAVLVVNFSGYERETAAIGDRTHFEFTLRASTTEIDEVVAIGYAKVRRRDLTGSVSSVGGADLVTVPAMNVAQALQGKATGINIVTASGAPGASQNVTIRGGSSITQGTSPLYIVDGFEMADAFNSIDANDILSIDILKDASSTAIYGARGSNGIVLITTKSATRGKTTVNYNAFVSFDRLSKYMEMISDVEAYAKYQYELGTMQGKLSQYADVFDNGMATDAAGFQSGAYGRIASAYGGKQGIDWQKDVFGGTAFTQNHSVNISSGTDEHRMMLSYNHASQDGLMVNSAMRRNSLRFKYDTEIFKGVRFDVNSLFSDTRTDGGGSYSGLKKVLLQPISGGTLFTEQQMRETQTYMDFNRADSGYDTENPMVESLASTSNKWNRQWLVNAGIEFDLLKDFTWRTAGQYQWSQGKGNSFADENSRAYLTGPTNPGMNGKITNSENFRWQITNTLNWNHTWGKHNVSALAGHEVNYNERMYEYEWTLTQFPKPGFGLGQIDNATLTEMSGSKASSTGLVSVFGRVNYNFDERYLLSASLRYDNSSKFAKGKRSGVFPSVSGAWRLSQEKFWQEGGIKRVLSDVKFRAGYGETGNDNISQGAWITPYNMSDYPINSGTPLNPVYVIGDRLGNTAVGWETMQATNVGADISLLGRRINLTVDWYNNTIDNMLMDAQIPTTTGHKSQYQNIGRMRNRGWEFSLNTVNFQPETADGFRWTTDFNISLNRSKVLYLSNGQEQMTFSEGGNRTGMVTYYANVGERLGDMYGYVYEGIYTTADFNTDGTLKEGVVKPNSGTPKPGDMKFAADNEDGDQFTRQMVKIGNGTPDAIGGLTNTFYYKGFDLNVFLKFSIGGNIYNATRHSLSPYAMYQNVLAETGDSYYRWVDPNTGQKVADTDYARLRELNPDESARTWSLNATNTGYITYPSSYFVEDASYLRLAQLSLGYTFPKAWVSKLKISNLRIYFTANNLATITGYSGYDPEISAANNDHVICTPGYDSSTYPRSRSYVAGINLTF